jgi:hypothetical protein
LREAGKQNNFAPKFKSKTNENKRMFGIDGNGIFFS